jgi:hypothetical protein
MRVWSESLRRPRGPRRRTPRTHAPPLCATNGYATPASRHVPTRPDDNPDSRTTRDASDLYSVSFNGGHSQGIKGHYPHSYRMMASPSPSPSPSLSPSPSPKRRKTEGGSSRASYLSPTKASLARFNPSLLSPSRSSPRRELQRRGSNVLDYVLGRTDALPAQALAKRKTETTESDSSSDEASGVNVVNEGEESVEEPEYGRRNSHFAQEREATDDLPETPHHEKERPEYQDTPPRGILFSTPRRRKRALEAISAAQPDDNAAITGDATTHAPSEDQYRLPTAEERAVLKAKTAQLNALRKDMRKLQHEVKSFERHLALQQNTAIDEPYPDVLGLL